MSPSFSIARKRHVMVFWATLAVGVGGASGGPPHRNKMPIELGAIRWRTDFEAARAEARSARKPLLVLFDEVPGCATVRRYGEEVLRHPVIVEVAESAFIPVVVYNNHQGEHRTTLESFGEPAWNNPVVRIIDSDRRALAPRLDGDYSVRGLAQAMAAALRKVGAAVPADLDAL